MVELRGATGLQPATLSKFEAGLLAAGIQIPGAPDLGPTDVGPASSVGDLAFAVVRRHLGVLLAREPGTRLGDDIEELHDMRVATRRLRAAFELFFAALPARAPALRAELKWLADALGAVRDLDVQLERMDEMSEWAAGWVGADHEAPLDHLRHLLEAERDLARRDLLDALDSPRWERLSSGLVSMARQGPNRRLAQVRVPAAVAVPPLVMERHAGVAKAAKRAKRTGVAADYHRLRIRCKRLRYSLEFTSGLYGSGTQKFVRELTSLQDALGLMQDAEVASVRLYALVTGSDSAGHAGADDPSGASLPATTVFVMGGVAEHYRLESEDLRRSMAKRLVVLGGKAWNGFVDVMGRARARAEVLPPATAPRPARRPSPAPTPAAREAAMPGDAASPAKGPVSSTAPAAAPGRGPSTVHAPDRHVEAAAAAAMAAVVDAGSTADPGVSVDLPIPGVTGPLGELAVETDAGAASAPSANGGGPAITS
jgi:CHAD domain-containing protein